MTDIPARPRRAPEFSAEQRTRLGTAFQDSPATVYHQVRPGYSRDILDFLHPSQGAYKALPTDLVAVDVGAGTGLMTKTLLEAGWSVTAVEPSENMLAELSANFPQVHTIRSSLEEVTEQQVATDSADLVVVAQAWHWIDQATGCAQLHRILKPGGVLGIVHHQLDTSVPWVHRLSRIMHAGDVHPIEQPPELSPDFTFPVGKWWNWTDKLLPEQFHQLMQTRAFYARASQTQRDRMHHNLNWYLHEHLGYRQDENIELPYVTAAWKAEPRT